MLKNLLIISSIFVALSFVLEMAVSFLTQNNIHPDYWKFGAPEKGGPLFIIFAAYVLVVMNSIKRFKKVRKNE